MSRYFTPQNDQRSPISPRNRFPPFQQPFSSNFSQQSPFGSPQASQNFYPGINAPSHDNRRRSNFELPSPSIASPQFHSSPRAFSPRNSSPRSYSPRNRSPYRSNNSSFNSSYSNQSNLSIGSTFDSSSRFADISGSSYSPSNSQKQKFQRNRSFDANSNPGHTSSIEDYIHPSMLEDPWEKDMIEYERQKKLSESKESTELMC